MKSFAGNATTVGGFRPYRLPPAPPAQSAEDQEKSSAPDPKCPKCKGTGRMGWKTVKLSGKRGRFIRIEIRCWCLKGDLL